MRTVICHYHIYKNSGTSFDTLLSENFGDNHICFDGPFPFFTIDQEQLTRTIDRKSNMIAFSSHQIQLPVPVSLDYLVLPVVFVRHPLIRILSIYKFKRQTDDGTLTSKNAQSMTFDEWICHCFADNQEITHISNAQTRILGAAFRQRPLMRRKPNMMEYDVHQAIRNIENVKLLARTEFFNQDVGRFSKILSGYDIDFKFEKIDPQNTTSKNHHKPISERLDAIKQLLTEEKHQKLLNANKQDLFLFDYASSLIDERITSTNDKVATI
jgi:hypothetical protein